MRPRVKPKSVARSVTYAYEGEFSESAVEKILELAKESGVVTEYDSGRGSVVWFSGSPGPALRKVREEVRAVPGVTGALKRI